MCQNFYSIDIINLLWKWLIQANVKWSDWLQISDTSDKTRPTPLGAALPNLLKPFGLWRWLTWITSLVTSGSQYSPCIFVKMRIEVTWAAGSNGMLVSTADMRGALVVCTTEITSTTSTVLRPNATLPGHTITSLEKLVLLFSQCLWNEPVELSFDFMDRI